jgi:hypothetical protein
MRDKSFDPHDACVACVSNDPPPAMAAPMNSRRFIDCPIVLKLGGFGFSLRALHIENMQITK